MAELIVRLVLSLGVVLGLVWFLYRVSQRKLGGSTSLLSVVGRQAVGRNASVTVVTVGGRVLVLGVSEHQVQLLTELDPESIDREEPVVETSSVIHETAAPSRSRTTPTATRGAHAATPRTREAGALGGSILSARTWRDAWAATRGGRTA